MSDKEIIFIDNDDRRPRELKWSDPEYLRNVRDFGRNNIFLTEIMHALDQMREKMDTAMTPEELKGYRECLKIIKNVLAAPFFAQKRLIEAQQIKEAQNDTES